MKVSYAYTFASFAALAVGVVGFCIGLFNAQMALNEKGYYFTLLLFGLFAAVSVQKSVRDDEESIPVSLAYIQLSYGAVIASLLLMGIGLWNANLALSEKGFYVMAFTLSMYAMVSVQKNIRDQRALSRLQSQLDQTARRARSE